MTRKPQDTSAEEPDGGNLQVRLRGGPGRGNQPGLLNKETITSFIGLDVHKDSIAIAVAQAGRQAPRFIETVAPELASLCKALRGGCQRQTHAGGLRGGPVRIRARTAFERARLYL
jgi:hypothetical protein